MLRRLNYKSLVNFDLELKPLALLMGPNGSGKSSVFEVVGLLRDFATGEGNVEDLFCTSSLTRWQSSDVQTFELVVDDSEEEGASFGYKLEIQHERVRRMCRIMSERLIHNGKPLYESRLDGPELKATLYRDNYTAGPEVLVDWSRSGVASLQPRPDNRKLTRFKSRMRQIFVIRIDPFRMSARSEKESATLSLDSTNFASWFRHITQSDLALFSRLAPLLQEALPGFDSIRLIPDGQDARLLLVRFKIGTADGHGRGDPPEYQFDEISEGQRVLILLYSVLAAFAESRQPYTLCLDEPDNFVALREIQPWLHGVMESVETSSCQSLLISHHPELINELATSHGLWLERTGGGATRATPVADDQTGLAPAELVARGWLNA